MTSVGGEKEPLKQVVIYRSDKERLGRVAGEDASVPKQIKRILDVIYRERRVEEFRRKILRIGELLESGITPEDSSPEPDEHQRSLPAGRR